MPSIQQDILQIYYRAIRLVSRSKLLMIVAGLALATLAMYRLTKRDDAQNSAEALEQRLAAKKEKRGPIETNSDSDSFEKLALAGKGQPLPDELTAGPDPSGFWFVGKEGSDHGVEIPFAPGHLPRPPSSGVDEASQTENESGFLGAQACKQCHEKRHQSFVQTAHFQTSAKATLQSIKGSFENGRNELKTDSEDVKFLMVERSGQTFQRTSFYGWNFEVPFGIVTGSSKMAQTYLYWHGDGLYQMNVSYLSSVDQ